MSISNDSRGKSIQVPFISPDDSRLCYFMIHLWSTLKEGRWMQWLRNCSNSILLRKPQNIGDMGKYCQEVKKNLGICLILNNNTWETLLLI